jgi:hypothetical protein
MKTTLDLPEELMQAVKIHAVQQKRKLKDAIASLLRRGLAAEPNRPPRAHKQVRLPLVRCRHEAREDLTPERVAEILLEEESEASRVSLR